MGLYVATAHRDGCVCCSLRGDELFLRS